MRIIRYIFLGLVLALFVTVSLVNNEPTVLTLSPSWVPFVGGVQLPAMPLAVLIIGALLIGVIFGVVMQGVSAVTQRRATSRANKALRKTEAELAEMKRKAGHHDDEVLAILK